jgi:hypothetical protein
MNSTTSGARRINQIPGVERGLESLARDLDRKTGPAPFRKPDVEPARAQPACTQQPHRLVGVHAIRAAAVRHHVCGGMS